MHQHDYKHAVRASEAGKERSVVLVLHLYIAVAGMVGTIVYIAFAGIDVYGLRQHSRQAHYSGHESVVCSSCDLVHIQVHQAAQDSQPPPLSLEALAHLASLAPQVST